jgi:hypothetical protein
VLCAGTQPDCHSSFGHYEGDGAIIQIRLLARLRGHRVQASRLTLSHRPILRPAQDQEPAAPAVKRETEEESR